ncbi:uncharacterized protein LOC130725050 [Lotus japonicus]|uniref:uncharacterized protein LOC130725050 n=1 Tax=Lotus japonicus TaxID=34305 RepID=UPI00258EAFCA|nr:uncharacterized protein LOC130725050 [Lotus japonicus]
MNCYLRGFSTNRSCAPYSTPVTIEFWRPTPQLAATVFASHSARIFSPYISRHNSHQKLLPPPLLRGLWLSSSSCCRHGCCEVCGCCRLFVIIGAVLRLVVKLISWLLLSSLICRFRVVLRGHEHKGDCDREKQYRFMEIVKSFGF